LARGDLINYDREELLFACLKQPIKRQVYDCIAQDGRSDQLFMYLMQRSEIRCLTNQNYLPGYVDCSEPNVQRFFEKLVTLGFLEEDEDKLLHMKEFIEKTRISRLSSSLHNVVVSSALSATTTTDGLGGSNSNSMHQMIGNSSPWSSSNLMIRDNNFITAKDGGYITIMKDKFQKCNVEYLNSRKIMNQQQLLSPTTLSATSSTANNTTMTSTALTPTSATSHLPIEQQINDELIQHGETSTTNNNNFAYNAEWKLMFGRNEDQQVSNKNLNKTRNSLKNEVTALTSATTTITTNTGTATSVMTASPTYYSLNQQLSQLMSSNKNCIVEVQRYLDRAKLCYEEHKLKKYKVDRHKETINSSACSGTNIVSLSQSLSAAKWRPKGYLLAHSNEHTKEITRLCRNADSSYFATCSSSEFSVKIWSTDMLLDGKSGFFKSVFTYDKQTSTAAAAASVSTTSTRHSATTAPSGSPTAQEMRPSCIAFYDRHSLAILGDDFRFHVIDFNSSRSQYHLYTHDKLFKPTTTLCLCGATASMRQNKFNQFGSIDKAQFYYLNKSLRNLNSTLFSMNKNEFKSSNALRICTNPHCQANNYPIEMIYLDEASPTWPIAASSNLHDYFRPSTTTGNATRGLFCYSSSMGSLSCIDLRTRTKAFDIRRDLSRGCITAMCSDPWHTWLALGTSNGSIELYDFRFMLPVMQTPFEHRSKTSVVKMCNHPNLASRVCASYQGNNEIAIWNMANTSSSSSAATTKQRSGGDPEFVFWGVQSVPPLCQNKMSNYYISGMIACSMGNGNDSSNDCGGLICASTDMKIRYIDLNEKNQMKETFLVSSPYNFQQQHQQTMKNVVNNYNNNPTNNNNTNEAINSKQQSTSNFEFATGSLTTGGKVVSYELRQIEGTKVLLEIDQYNSNQSTAFNLNTTTTIGGTNNVTTALSYNSPALTHQNQFTHHSDAISDLIVCYNHFNTKSTPLIVTGARDGALKIWK
jgi:hypothetical protein